MTRRTLVGSVAFAAAAQTQRPERPKEWKPRLGILGPFTEANVQLAHQDGFTNMILAGTRNSTLDETKITPEHTENVQSTLALTCISASPHQHVPNATDPG